MITVTLFYRDDNEVCEQAERDLAALQEVVPHQLIKLNVDQDASLNDVFKEQVPVVQVGPYILRTPFTKQDLQVSLTAASQRMDHMTNLDDEKFQKRLKRGHTLNGTDQFSYWISNHYMLVFNLLVFLYVGLPFLAPVLLKINVTGPAQIIYTIYSPLCHQLAFRSWFLFGKQPYYPRALADISGVITYEQLSGQTQLDLIAARQFVGNAIVGYKVAICQRDVAIYGSILLFGLIYAVTGKKLRSFPWYVWVIIGLLPIAVDGVSQLPDLLNIGNLPSWVPLRESTPFLRTLTGGLFGFTTAWYLYPLIEETMLETRRTILRKMAVVEQSKPIQSVQN
ncbi:MAG: DUF2085 domain-containing protein [Anaerolineaceae bacterium]|nr:DUF2085 domain-containing protein [Anaerolineaceae bacterium]